MEYCCLPRLAEVAVDIFIALCRGLCPVCVQSHCMCTISGRFFWVVVVIRRVCIFPMGETGHVGIVRRAISSVSTHTHIHLFFYLSSYIATPFCSQSVGVFTSINLQLFIFRSFGSESLWVYIVLLIINGMLINGPYGMITTAVSSDLVSAFTHAHVAIN